MARQAPCLMVQGTGSGVGKSLLTAALCRLFARAGYRVTPFKAQNMALNAAVADGGEIGRAQAAQAEAAGIEPTVDMNPILLKPEGDLRSQVVIRGVAVRRVDVATYHAMAPELLTVVGERLERLRATHDLVVIDIDRGGVFASLVGTLALLDPDDRARVAGFVINRFRGERRVLDPGLDMLTARTGVAVLGVVPFVHERLVPAEDSLDLECAA